MKETKKSIRIYLTLVAASGAWFIYHLQDEGGMSALALSLEALLIYGALDCDRLLNHRPRLLQAFVLMPVLPLVIAYVRSVAQGFALFQLILVLIPVAVSAYFAREIARLSFRGAHKKDA
jgi:hypothetical protein